MFFYSSQNPSQRLSFLQAVKQGLAEDGGLFLPESFSHPLVTLEKNYSQFATKFLNPFVSEDLSTSELENMCARAFTFPVPLTELTSKLHLLELFCGPSLSFKDFGAQFLAQVLCHKTLERKLLVLVATSGDTGAAVAASFYQKQNTKAVILYPKGKVSPRQAQQLSCWGDNVTTLSVEGNFDQCQALVKEAFKQKKLHDNFELTTANSINIGRLLPQVVYYAYSSLMYQNKFKEPYNLIVPSGNLGNVTAAFWAQKMGYPIGDIILAQNINSPVSDYLKTGDYKEHESIPTLANAMDVGAPSNFIRVKNLFPKWEEFKKQVLAFKVENHEIEVAIKDCYHKYSKILCPHTAVAYHVLTHKLDQTKPWVIAATAHPAKFSEIIEPLIGQEILVPKNFKEQLERPRVEHKIKAHMDQILSLLV